MKLSTASVHTGSRFTKRTSIEMWKSTFVLISQNHTELNDLSSSHKQLLYTLHPSKNTHSIPVQQIAVLGFYTWETQHPLRRLSCPQTTTTTHTQGCAQRCTMHPIGSHAYTHWCESRNCATSCPPARSVVPPLPMAAHQLGREGFRVNIWGPGFFGLG